jgi:hypothetical protein
VLARIPQAVAAPPRPHRRSAAVTEHQHFSPGTVPGAVYRVDPPQSFAPHRGHTTTADEPTKRPPYRVASPFRAAVDDGGRLPIPIQLAVQTWRLFQPYQPLLRVAAMFALVAGGGMSLALMVGGGIRSQDGPASATAVAVDQSAPHGEDAVAKPPAVPSRESAADLDPARQLDDDGEQTTTSVAPTAIGPAGSADRSGYAQITPPEAIAPGDPGTEPPVTAGDESVTPAVPVYPTTSYPTLSLPNGGYGPLPQARTAKPPTAVARLKGHIEEVQPR